ncbi:AEC family transporter [Notoacmeibacter sp. MSK16QG-6]|uniref:AEC family transporter n=1 Tax=Notoacmeibacter sp. MSK16QG-6 TaxID=2957982 RepID=UPI00209E85BF|nr:AEC family transporter [Notoacmeibacter sp. MSK16QG-6]MCP1199212.1 AEC family transporter [Notoacmeibacter sp. MSK16QG-6]
MLDIISITGPVFIIIAVGFAATKSGLLNEADIRGVGRFVLVIALPALIFRAVAIRPMSEVIEPGYVLAYALGSFVMLAAAYLFSRRITGLDQSQAAMRSMGMTCPNSGFIGFPVFLILLPDIAAQILALNFIVENVMLVPILLLLAEQGRENGHYGSVWKTVLATLSRLARTPLMIAIALSIPVSLVGFEIPSVVERPLALLADVAVGASLFYVGAMLAILGLTGMNSQAIVTVIGKLVIHPLVLIGVYIGLFALGMANLDHPMILALVVTGALPAFSVYPILAGNYGYGAEAGFALIVMTAASFFSLTLLLYLMNGATGQALIHAL